MIQTRLPDHAVLQFALTHDVAGFIEHELQARREAHYPPFARLALVRFDAVDDQRVRSEAERVGRIASSQLPVQNGLVEVLGPSPAPLERLRGRYRHRILLRADTRAPLRTVARAVLQAQHGGDRLVRMSVDIDPVHML
jgi:primosomal protein N' (replication factor Y)